MQRIIESPAWYAGSVYLDPSGQLFSSDIDRALKLAKKRVDEKDDISYLSHIVGWSLLYASVRSRATQVSIEALETMVLLDESGLALRYAALIADPEQRADAYLRLSSLLHERREEKSCNKALIQALAAAENIPDDYHRSKVLSGVAQTAARAGDRDVSQQALTGALTAARNISDDNHRSEAFCAVARVTALLGDREGARRGLMEALAAANRIYDVKRFYHALSDVAQAMAQNGDRETALRILTRALTSAEALQIWRS